MVSAVPVNGGVCATRAYEILSNISFFNGKSRGIFTIPYARPPLGRRPSRVHTGYRVTPDNHQLREPCGLTYFQLGDLSDDRVMQHLAAGHGDAIAVLLDRFERLVFSIAFRIVRNRAEAEDVAQEVFVDLSRTAARFDASKGSTKMWIVRASYRRSLNRRRYLNVRDAHLPDDGEELLKSQAAAEFLAAPKLTPYESQRLVRQILASLGAGQRRVLELVFFDGLSMRDVAEKTGASLESVRHRYYRGLEKLRELMHEPLARQRVPQTQEIPDAGA
jgi:RNA polymerase sigma-70 factor (ECF subfamily)